MVGDHPYQTLEDRPGPHTGIQDPGQDPGQGQGHIQDLVQDRGVLPNIPLNGTGVLPLHHFCMLYRVIFFSFIMSHILIDII